MKKIFNKKLNAGITLIALVITIVVLIILAAVAINLSMGENGLFSRARFAKESYKNAQDKEETDIEKITNKINTYVEGDRDTTTPYCTTPATSLTVSASSTTSPCIVVESYRDGSNWCRVWSDGWIEQGGYDTAGNTSAGKQINLIKNFTTTNYNIQTSICHPGMTTSNARSLQCVEQTLSGFKVFGGYTSADPNGNAVLGFAEFKFYWYACGY